MLSEAKDIPSIILRIQIRSGLFSALKKQGKPLRLKNVHKKFIIFLPRAKFFFASIFSPGYTCIRYPFYEIYTRCCQVHLNMSFPDAKKG